MALKDEILRLHSEGKSYRDIAATLNCSKGTIAFHISPGQREKTNARLRKHRKDNPLQVKLHKFREAVLNRKERTKPVGIKNRNPIERKRNDFCKILNSRKGKGCRVLLNFTTADIINKIGADPTCYLTGRKVDLSKSESYSFDHITPVAQGGDASLNNLGLTCAQANAAKADLTVEQFLSLCQEVLVHHGYEVRLPGSKKA